MAEGIGATLVPLHPSQYRNKDFTSAVMAAYDAVVAQMYGGSQGGEPLDDLPDYVAPRESPASDPARAKRLRNSANSVRTVA
mgnify:CR=1 FL=1